MKKLFTLLTCIGVMGTSIAQTVMQENFDGGIPGTWAINDFQSDNLTWFGTTGGYGGGGTNFLDGTEFAFVDSDADGNGTEMVEDLVSPTFDGSLYTTLTLTFDQFYRNLNGNDSGQVYISSDGGATWNLLAEYVAVDYGAWNAPDQQTLDLTPYISNNMQLMFHYDDDNEWAWWWAIDNVHVFAPVPDDAGVVAVGGPMGGRELTSTAMTATESINITVENFGGNSLSNIPVYYRVNGGAPVMETMAGPIAPGATGMHTFTATVDMSAAGSYTVDAWTMLAGDGNSSNDTLMGGLTANQVGNPATMLPFCADFEMASDTAIRNNTTGVAGINYLDFETDAPGIGRMRTAAGAAYNLSGNRAITMDIDPDGAIQINFATLTFNLAAYDANNDDILLDYSFMEHGDEVHGNDLIWVRGSDVDPWIQIGDWNTISGGTNGQYFTQAGIDLSATLLGNGQNYSTSTQFRAGQEDNFPSTSTTQSDGLTIDDVKLNLLVADDAGPIALTQPMDEDCGDSLAVVCVEVENFGTNTIFPGMPVTLNWAGPGGSGSDVATMNDTLAFGETGVVCFSPINTYDGGVFNLEVITGLAGDAVTNNDTMNWSVFITPIPMAPMVTGDTMVCPADTMAYLWVMNPDSMLSYEWFDSDTATTAIASGDSVCLDVSGGSANFYVEASGSTSFRIGAPDTTIGGTGTYSNYPDGLRFNAMTDIIIEEVKVYPENAGDLVVRVLDNTMTVVDTRTITVNPGTPFEPTYITLNMSIPAGTGYYIDLVGSTVSQVLRNSSGGTYPYAEPGVMDIYEAINQLGGYYYFFYDWSVRTAGCSGPRVCIPVMVDTSTVQAGFTHTTNILDAMFTDASTGNVVDGIYDFGDGNTSTGQNPTHTYAAPGSYVVCQTVWNVCGDTSTFCDTVTVINTGIIGQVIEGAVIDIYPNPSNGQFTVNIEVDSAEEINFDITDAAGRVLLSENFATVAGTLRRDVNLGNLSAGIYFVNINVDGKYAVRKVMIK